MKSVLLAGMMLVTPAHAQDMLPSYILGTWCRAPDVSNESQEVYFRSNEGVCLEFRDGITINPEGYDSDEPVVDPPTCLFDNVKRKESDTYLAHVHCKEGDKPSFEGDEEFQLINELLFKKRRAEGCTLARRRGGIEWGPNSVKNSDAPVSKSRPKALALAKKTALCEGTGP
jgi:hypothetical protein